MRDDLSLPKDFTEMVEAKRPAQPADRHYTCPVCRQQVDRVNLDQVYHHTAEPHAPLVSG